MKKVLFYYCYVPGTYSRLQDHVQTGYRLHLKYLRKYIDIFDEAIIYFGSNNPDNDILLVEWEKIFRRYLKDTKIPYKFIPCPNDKDNRDSVIYRDYIIRQLDNYKDCLLFFAHSKGAGNLIQLPPPGSSWSTPDGNLTTISDVYEWIAALYYFNLDSTEKIFTQLEDPNDKMSCYGSLFLNFEAMSPGYLSRNRYHWIYSGSFQWINVNKMLQYIKDNHINLDRVLITTRYFSEDFLGTLFPLEYAGGVGVDDPGEDFNDYLEIDDHIKYLYSEDEYLNFLVNFDCVLNSPD